ncbi:MAG TPA: thioredoxin domain-containing protein [Polyangiales bacterium]|nr:thioredoxin domain-containing protein [Polyangiales bacterium]
MNKAARRLALASASLVLGCSALACSPHRSERPAPSAVAPLPDKDDDPALRAKLQLALRSKGSSYVPRTRHKNADGSPKYTNRLILESSPYLLQHAHNPVDWFPWSDAAFERARKLHRPVFLSVGYSTCHWCHVMEEESFEDEEIARYLNDHYVCIKVDREVRPDIDANYMSFVEALTGSGGWPMNVWLTPAREPFFGGTYFPPRASSNRGAREGLLEILQAQADRFARDPVSLTEQATKFSRQLMAASQPQAAGAAPNADVIEAAVDEAARRFDPINGGARGAPKFPSSFPVRLLLRVSHRNDDADARAMAFTTLDHMRAGGIYDQVGGGFHRYSTDARWLVPHFEKMLYDNALLAIAYLEAAQASGDARYVETVRAVLDYLLRDMQAPNGTFYSATDADSADAEGTRKEGLFFTWTPSELDAVLGDDAHVAQTWFGVTRVGELDGRSVLHVDGTLSDVAAALNLTPAVLHDKLARIQLALLDARSQRVPPARDEKIIVAWNALTVSALARAAIVLGDARYASAAVRCASALIASGRIGALPHVIVGGVAQGRAFADDDATLAAALLDVFELTAEPHWLDDAKQLMETLEREFGDAANGGYFLTASQHERLLLREKPSEDGPIPSVNSLAALTWLRLATLSEDARDRPRAERTFRAFSRSLAREPLSHEQMLIALDWAVQPVKEIAIVVADGRGAMTPEARTFLDALAHRFVPNAVIAVASEADIAGALGARLPWLQGKVLQGGRATAYMCEHGSCQLPTTEPSVFAQQLLAATPTR